MRLYYLIFLAFLVTCRDTNSRGGLDIQPKDTLMVSKKEETWMGPEEQAELYLEELSPKADKILQQWTEFGDLEVVFKEMVKTDGEGLIGLSELLLERCRELNESEFPKKFNVTAVKSRLVVINTLAIKLRDLITFQGSTEEEVKQCVLELFEAQNALRRRMEDLLQVSLDEDDFIPKQDN